MTQILTKIPTVDDKTADLVPDDFSQICKALGHPARVRIVQYLRKIDRCICQEIVNILPLSQSTVSQHLKILKQSGLIQGEVEGPRTCYCLDLDLLDQFKKTVDSL